MGDCIFFFFVKYIKLVLKTPKRGRTKVRIMYTTAANKRQKSTGKTKNLLPQIKPNQSIKSIMDIELLLINSLVQVNKLHINKIFSL